MSENTSLDPSYLEDTIGYHFQNRKYLLTALTHSSYANEGKHLSVWNFWEMRCLA